MQSKGVTVEDFVTTEDFLTIHYGITSYLYEVPERISGYFENASLSLGVFSDPDSPEEVSELFVEIETILSPEEANDRLSNLNREWLLSSENEELASLNVTLKFL